MKQQKSTTVFRRGTQRTGPITTAWRTRWNQVWNISLSTRSIISITDPQQVPLSKLQLWTVCFAFFSFRRYCWRKTQDLRRSLGEVSQRTGSSPASPQLPLWCVQCCISYQNCFHLALWKLSERLNCLFVWRWQVQRVSGQVSEDELQ